LKQFFKNWILPPKITFKMEALSSLYYAKNQPGFGSVKDNHKIKDIHKDERCFILGNGPSIKDIPDCSKLENEIVFSISSLFLYEKYKLLNAQYHITTFMKIPMLKERKDWLDKMGETITAKKVFFHINQYDYIANSPYFSKVDKHFISTANIERTFDISNVTKGYRTNPLMALEIAMYMGFKEIYLMGIEHNSFVDMKYPYVFGRNQWKFNDANIKKSDSVTHTMTESFNRHYKTYSEFNDIAEYAKQNDIKIINLSSISRLDMFEKKKIEEVI
jgi:hypothetical protein